MTPEIAEPASSPAPPPPGWRLNLGVALFLLSLFCPLGVPLVALTNLSLAWKATISGILMLGGPEVLALLAVVFLGKSGFVYLKAKAYGLFKQYALPREVSRGRYRLGLALFIVPLFCGCCGLMWPT